MAAGEFRMRPPGPAVGGLNRTKELLLEGVRGMLVNLLVGFSERGQGKRQLVDGLGELVEELHPG